MSEAIPVSAFFSQVGRICDLRSATGTYRFAIIPIGLAFAVRRFPHRAPHRCEKLMKWPRERWKGKWARVPAV